MEIPIPFLKQPVGSGDIVKAATGAVGVKPCSPCEERRKRMNAALQFVPRGNSWTKPPDVPEGWKCERAFAGASKGVKLFHNATTGAYVVWEIIGGEYRHSHSFCCETMREQALAKWSETCR